MYVLGETEESWWNHSSESRHLNIEIDKTSVCWLQWIIAAVSAGRQPPAKRLKIIAEEQSPVPQPPADAVSTGSLNSV